MEERLTQLMFADGSKLNKTFKGEGTFFGFVDSGNFALKRCLIQHALVQIEDRTIAVGNSDFDESQDSIPGVVFDIAAEMEMTLYDIRDEEGCGFRFKQIERNELLADFEWISIEFQEEKPAAGFAGSLGLVLNKRKQVKRETFLSFLTVDQSPSVSQLPNAQDRARLIKTHYTPPTHLIAPIISESPENSDSDSENSVRNPVSIPRLVSKLPSSYTPDRLLFLQEADFFEYEPVTSHTILHTLKVLFLVCKTPVLSIDVVHDTEVLERFVLTSKSRYDIDVENKSVIWNNGKRWWTVKCTHEIDALPHLLQGAVNQVSAESIPGIYQELAPGVVPRKNIGEVVLEEESGSLHPRACTLLPHCTMQTSALSLDNQSLFAVTDTTMEIFTKSAEALRTRSSVKSVQADNILVSDAYEDHVLLYSSARDCISLCNLTRSEITEDWAQPHNVLGVADAQDRRTLLVIGKQSNWRLDPRVHRKVVDENVFATNMDFTSLATCGRGWSVGSALGVLRLYSGKMKKAKNNIVSDKEKILSLDVSLDGKWVLCTFQRYLELVDTDFDQQSGYLGAIPKAKVKKRRFSVSQPDLDLRHINTSFTPARFDNKADPAYIVSSLDSYIVIWDFHDLVTEGRVSYKVNDRQMTRTREHIANVQFSVFDQVISVSDHSVSLFTR